VLRDRITELEQQLASLESKRTTVV